MDARRRDRGLVRDPLSDLGSFSTSNPPMNPKGAFRSLGSQRSSTFVIFSRQPMRREGEGGQSRGKRTERERMFGQKETSRISIFGFENRDELCFESSTIYTYIYTHSAIFPVSSIFASSFSCPIVFQAIRAFELFFAISPCPFVSCV